MVQLLLFEQGWSSPGVSLYWLAWEGSPGACDVQLFKLLSPSKSLRCEWEDPGLCEVLRYHRCLKIRLRI